LILPLLRGDVELPSGYLRGIRTKARSAGVVPRSLAAAALYRQGRYGDIAALYEGTAPSATAASSWDGLLPHMARLRTGDGAADVDAAEKIRVFLFGTAPGQDLTWAAEEIRRSLPDLLGEPEEAALKGRIATARSSFNTGLSLFQVVLEAQPGLFQRYPALVTDLGRCFQFTDSGDEGIDLFLAWEQAAPSAALRYQFLYFAGRIARARGDYDRGRDLFTQALVFAPDDLQEDACVWYIMDAALRDPATDPVTLLTIWSPRWNDPPYFDDVLDWAACSLAVSGQWRRFPDALAVLRNVASRASIAKYAYISGRVIALGLVPAGGSPGGRAGEAAQWEAAQPWFRLAYEVGEGALYYRALSAYFLGEPFLDLLYDEPVLPGGSRTREGPESSRAADYPRFQEMEFLLGFFDAGIPGLAQPWIETMAEELSIGELRVLAEAMEAAGDYAGQIRLVSAYMDRDDYEITRRDLELLSPRPFLEPVEEEARRAGLAPELLYGLVRTESAFQAEIVSWAGAVGLTQLMPATAADMAGRIRARGGPNYTGGIDLLNPEINLHIGAYYLAYLRDLIENPLLSILAYNGGMNRVRRWYREAAENFVPTLPGDLFLETVELAETRNYGRKVVSATLLYGYLYYDVKADTFLADICR
jgi:soluble lytic murein transglycosylase